ncbi:MAG TPA: ATP-dependent helicase C-terminal domain-containing protein [Pyrinomonadaceae bacterium]|nr:ATP-dependent helicase C-terminal domain-containing protein [Pyrinomonadaceae bacterium]
MQPLPVDPLLPDVADALSRAPSLVIEAPPGAGKTTRVPPALLDAGLGGAGEILVLEPRRLAARLSARRVAEERGEEVGRTVGYQVRFEDVSGPRTRIRFVTEGVLTRRLLSDPRLEGVGAVVLDEFHERHLQTDLALALLKRLQATARPDLRLVVMSATLDAEPVSRYLGGCPRLRSEGRRFEVAVEHLARHDERPLETLVAEAAARLVREGLDGDVLVFLPGASAIHRAQGACERLAAEAGLLVLPLHGELSAEAQDRAVRPADRRKLILSTNVAETSVTVEGLAAVIDSGLARVAGHSPWSGLPALKIGRVSRASAAQRAGRAGRTREGRCLRLYTAQDFALRPEFETPEVRRLDLSEAVLELRAAGVGDVLGFDWFEPPPAEAVAAADSLLGRLGAVDAAGRLSETGREMLRLPLHPRLARLVIEAERRGVGREACLLAALAGERDIRSRPDAFNSHPHGSRGARHPDSRATRPPVQSRRRMSGGADRHADSDLLELYELFAEAERGRFEPSLLRELSLDGGAVRAAARVASQLSRTLSAMPRGKTTRETRPVYMAGQSARDAVAATGSGGERARDVDARRRGAVASFPLTREAEEALLVSTLAGFPDRVARRRGAQQGAREASGELLLAGGGSARLAPESVVGGTEFLAAVEAEERPQPGTRGPSVFVRLASRVEPEWLLDLFPESLKDETEVVWNPEAERVEVTSRLVYDGLVIEESKPRRGGGPEAARALAGAAEAAQAAGLRAFGDAGPIESFLARVEFLSRALPEEGLPPLGEEDALGALRELCEGRTSFAELRAAFKAGELLERLRSRLTPEQSRLLSREAPERVALARGRQARVTYTRGAEPYLASRLQDFFGMREAPRVARGRVPLVLHLLAPSQRPVQVTTDLAGFWQRHYPRVRQELGRRYPKHQWPPDPLSA